MTVDSSEALKLEALNASCAALDVCAAEESVNGPRGSIEKVASAAIGGAQPPIWSTTLPRLPGIVRRSNALRASGRG
jgi:hypothetical protein